MFIYRNVLLIYLTKLFYRYNKKRAYKCRSTRTNRFLEVLQLMSQKYNITSQPIFPIFIYFESYSLCLYVSTARLALHNSLSFFEHIREEHKKVFFLVVRPLRFYPPPLVVHPTFFFIIAWSGFWQFFLSLPNFWAKTANFLG